MVILAIMNALAGIALGSIFRFIILLPVISLGAICIIGTGFALGSSTWSVVVAIAVSATALQCGYLAGATVRALLSARRAESTRSLAGAAIFKPVRTSSVFRRKPGTTGECRARPRRSPSRDL
jgi:hypothetical protein